MTARQLFLLSPYRPPTSYPVSLSAEESAAWLHGYLALWHPAALAGAVLPPAAASAYDHNVPIANAVYALAQGPSLYLPDGWAESVREAGAFTFDATASAEETYRNLLAALGTSCAADAAVVRSLRGLGYAYLMLDTLFEASNHERLLDLELFWQHVQAAVHCASDALAAKEPLWPRRSGCAPPARASTAAG
jgi:hypothetical protein